MEPYSGKILEKHLESLTEWLIQRFKEKIDFTDTSRDKKVAYYWFDILPDSFDISLGDVSFHHSFAGFHFIRGSELFPYQDIFLSYNDLNIFLRWFSACFIKAGGKSLEQKYLISYHRDPNYFSVQDGRWLNSDELFLISTQKKTNLFFHKPTGLKLTFPVYFQYRDEDHDEDDYTSRLHLYFDFERSRFDVEIEFSPDDSLDEALSRLNFLKKKKADLLVWKESLEAMGMPIDSVSEVPVLPNCPSMRITTRDPFSGDQKFFLCFYAQDPDDSEAVYSFQLRCTNYEPEYDIFLNALVSKTSTEDVQRKWWKWW